MKGIIQMLLFSPADVKRIAKINSNQLSYWLKIDLVEPVKPSNGRGTQAVFDERNCFEVFLAAEMIRSGFAMSAVKQILRFLKENWEAARQHVICTNGKDFIKMFSLDQSIKTLPIKHSPIFVLHLDELLLKFWKQVNQPLEGGS